MEYNETKMEKLKKVNRILYFIALLFAGLFLLRQVFSINLVPFMDFTPNGHILLTIFSGLLLLASSLIEVKMTKMRGDKVNILSLAIDIFLAAIIVAYGIYIYNLPAGMCPLDFPNNWNQIKN